MKVAELLDGFVALFQRRQDDAGSQLSNSEGILQNGLATNRS